MEQIVYGSPRHQRAMTIVEAIKDLKLPEIKDVYIDDWDDYGTFYLLAELDLNEFLFPTTKNFNLNRVSRKIRQLINNHSWAKCYGVYHPERRYRYVDQYTREFDGYERSLTWIHVYIYPE